MSKYCTTCRLSSPPKQKAKLLLFLISSLCAIQANTEEQSSTITINSDKAQYDQNTGKAVYTGNVIAKQKDKTLNSDVLVMIKDKDNFEKFIATGKNKRARVLDFKSSNNSNGDGKANKIVYYINENKAELIGNAELTQDGYTVTGDKLVYFFDTKRLVSAGNNKTRTTFVLQQNNLKKDSNESANSK